MMMQDQVLKILFIEDMPEDLELAKRKIQSSGITFESYLAETEDEFLRGLYDFKPDIVISDYILPEFDGMRALEITLTYDATVPFLILTGAANEEIITDAMKAGASDYILKERINRLPFAIKEAVKKRDTLLENKQTFDSLRFLSQIIEQSPYSVISTDMEGIITSWNNGAEKIFGYNAREALGQHISIVYLDSDLQMLNDEIISPLITNEQLHKKVRLKRKDGKTFIGSLSLWVVRDRTNRPAGMVGYTLDISKAIKVEEELKIKDQAIECSVDGIALVDRDGRIYYVNKAVLKMWGFDKKEEVLGMRPEDFFDAESNRREILEMAPQHGFKAEMLAKRKDGSTFPIWLSTSIIRNKENEPIAYMSSLIDITERKIAEKAMKKSEELYRLLAENTLDCIWMMDIDLVFTYVNPAIYPMLGFTPEEWIGSRLVDHFEEDDINRMMGYIQMGIEKPADFPGIRFQAEALNKNGEKVPVEIIGKVLTDDSGNPIALHGTTRDITKNVVAEKAMKDSEERLELAMTVAEHGFWDWDLENNEFYFSSISYKMLGYEDNEFPMSLEKWEEIMHPDDRKEIMPKIIGSVKKGDPFNFEIRMSSKSGDWIWIQAKGATFSDNKGNNRAIGTLVDITERKRTEEQMLLARIAAEDANRCKNELLANMNHELRTPLNSVIGYSDVLIDLNIGDLTTEQRKYIQIINNAGYKLLNLINNMLDLAQIESDGMGLRFTSFEPGKIIEKVVDGTRLLARKKRITVNVHVHDEIAEITADVDKFREILYNLVENALKFTPKNGTVSIEAGIRDDDIQVSVTDTGIGIAEKDRERIFDPFVQVDGSNTRRFGGAGLGLVLVKEYLKMQNGTIWVESETDKGSKFTFRIPISPLGRGNDI